MLKPDTLNPDSSPMDIALLKTFKTIDADFSYTEIKDFLKHSFLEIYIQYPC